MYNSKLRKKMTGNSFERHSRTGGILGAVPSATVMGAPRIFFQGGGQIQGCKKLTTFIEHFKVASVSPGTVTDSVTLFLPKNVQSSSLKVIK